MEAVELEGVERTRAKVSFPQTLYFFLIDINKEVRVARANRGIALMDMIDYLESEISFKRDKVYDKAIAELDENRDKQPLYIRHSSDYRIRYAREKLMHLTSLMFRVGYLEEAEPSGDEFIE